MTLLSTTIARRCAGMFPTFRRRRPISISSYLDSDDYVASPLVGKVLLDAANESSHILVKIRVGPYCDAVAIGKR